MVTRPSQRFDFRIGQLPVLRRITVWWIVVSRWRFSAFSFSLLTFSKLLFAFVTRVFLLS